MTKKKGPQIFCKPVDLFLCRDEWFWFLNEAGDLDGDQDVLNHLASPDFN